MTIGERVKARRKELGISVDELAARLGKNRATVYRYESNSIENMPAGVLEPLAKVLQTTPAQLLGIPEDVDPYFTLAILQDGESGRANAREEMFRLYGDEHCAVSTRIMGDGMAVLSYQWFSDRDAAAVFGELLRLLRGTSRNDLDAVYGMVAGYLHRGQRNAVPQYGEVQPEDD